jgi:hypothetical protein
VAALPRDDDRNLPTLNVFVDSSTPSTLLAEDGLTGSRCVYPARVGRQVLAAHHTIGLLVECNGPHGAGARRDVLRPRAPFHITTNPHPVGQRGGGRSQLRAIGNAVGLFSSGVIEAIKTEREKRDAPLLAPAAVT